MQRNFDHLIGPDAPHRPGRRFFHWLLRLLIFVLVRIDQQGVEHLPENGPVLLYYNHIHYVDPFVIIGLLRGGRYAVPIAKSELSTGPVIGQWVSWFGTIFVERGEVDISAARAGLAVLQNGDVLMVAPEGTRNKVDQSLQKAQPGLGMFVRRTNAVLQPVAIWGTPSFTSELKRLRRAVFHIRYGRPFRVVVPPDVPRREADVVISDLAMEELAALLPADMQGVYSPRQEPHPWLMPIGAEE
jgi:1-acyl-sn-glycerol-3-phosphate acyltransferase